MQHEASPGPLPRLTRKVFWDLAVWMTACGLVTGLIFPPFVVLLGVPSASAFTGRFAAACVIAGLLVGAANYALARMVVGTRIAQLAARMRDVETALERGVFDESWDGPNAESSLMLTDSDDEIGESARAFNAMAQQVAHGRRQLTHQALHDSLTGLSNRTLLMNRLEHALKSIARTGRPLAVAYLDLDDFKSINDSLGHAAGDELLVLTAERIGVAVRAQDTLARIGGDEFALLMEDVDETDAARIAERIIEELSRPFTLHGRDTVVRASVGISVSDSGSEAAADLLRHADLAMYSTKSHRKGLFGFYEPAMHVHAVDRLGAEADLRRAVKREEFTLNYQPIIDLRTKSVAGMEALLRWQHPTRGLLPPSDFLPLADEIGLLVPIGAWALRRACHQVVLWQRQLPGMSVVKLHFNLSQRELSQPNIVQQVRSALQDAGLEPSSLVLEITEQSLLGDAEARAAGALEQLSALGVRVALDNFGSGYSSLGRLRGLPIDLIKIDRAIVQELGGPSDAGAELIHAIVALARALGSRTVGEGIERPEQRDELARLGGDLGQGFYLSQPLDDDAILALLSRSLTEDQSTAS